MRRARSVTGPLRRAHPASGATWNVQVVKGKMSSQCLWHACRALSAGLLLMLLGAAMAVIGQRISFDIQRGNAASLLGTLPVDSDLGYYAESLSVAEEIVGNATISVKDEARGFHLNNLSYAGPIVMGFGGFIVVAACVMTFEARDSAAKVTPARPQSIPRPAIRQAPRRAANGIAPARLDQLGVYLPHPHVPLAHALPLAPSHRHRHHLHANNRNLTEKEKCHNRYGSAPDLRAAGSRAVSIALLRKPLRRYALSVDEPPHSTFSASALESECGSQSSLAMELHGSGGTAGVTLKVRDNTRRRPLARQSRLHEDMIPLSTAGSSTNVEGSTVRINESAIFDHPEMQHGEGSSNVPSEQVQLTMVHHPPDICIQIEESPPNSEQNPEDIADDIQPNTEENDVTMSEDPC